ncbi:EAL domain-containing protein [Deferribacter autotrophicus]|uniref:EAL domain-containing protein n=1 Tax=Deferribacter autotrophicus TaxID=500465 RepID=A0A5A8F5I1_9BACT|nr:EAL domain-containing protein [Deferribacter autotrophicus]KAA0259386.1 EAL domain-containing protein [Deferribacter autotrophicus]
MKRNLSIYLIIIFGSLLALFSGYLIINSESDYRKYLSIVSHVEMLGRLENELNRKILECSFLLYYNYDEVIDVYDRLLKHADELFDDLNQPESNYYKKSKELVSAYEELLIKKNKDLHKFIRYNSTIKNSLVYIPTLILKHTESSQVNGYHYLQMFTNIVSTLLLIRNNLDLEMLDILEENIKFIKSHEPDSELDKLIHDKILRHLEVFSKYYPSYVMLLNRLTDTRSLSLLKQMKTVYQKENQYTFKKLLLLAILFSAGIIMAISFIVYYIVRLKKAATIDHLTGLYNRNRLIHELDYSKHHMLFIVNIDDFKHINNFYGVRIGDEFLKVFGKKLKELVKDYCRAKVYRLGSDDFGVLVRKENVDNPEKFANYLVNKIENNEFKIDQWDISVSVSIGISMEEPLLEKADIALKYVKRDSRLKYAVYKEVLNFEKDVEINMKILKALKIALESDKIVPYYQPIVDNKTGVISKYECLVRMFDEKGEMISPGIFLEVAKKGKLYGELTKRVVEKAFSYFKDKPCEFSVNISVDDIIDFSTKSFIIDKLKKYPEIAKKVTFEILESEGIENFDIVSEFIKDVKQYGASIAIDDFGSGYSNFSYLLQLNVDYIKIDGSLIKNIHIDENSELVVRTIVSFAKKLNIKTVAEYVHNEEVHKKVIELGIDYSQGFFIGKPLASCY